jgi:hypothetical protein
MFRVVFSTIADDSTPIAKKDKRHGVDFRSSNSNSNNNNDGDMMV